MVKSQEKNGCFFINIFLSLHLENYIFVIHNHDTFHEIIMSYNRL